MKTNWKHFYKSVLKTCGAVAAAALLSSCAATAVKNTWKSPSYQGPAGKIAALTVEGRGLVREGFENRLVAQLKQAGNTAMPTYDLLSFDEIKADKRAASERLSANGVETLLILRLADSSETYKQVQPGKERYAAYVSGYDATDWYGYYSVAFMNMTTTYGSLTRQAYLEATLFDLKSEKRIWSGVSKTVIKEGMDLVAEMDPLVAKMLAAMRKDGVIK